MICDCLSGSVAERHPVYVAELNDQIRVRFEVALRDPDIDMAA